MNIPKGSVDDHINELCRGFDSFFRENEGPITDNEFFVVKAAILYTYNQLSAAPPAPQEAATPAMESGEETCCTWKEDGSLLWLTSCKTEWPESSDADPIEEWMKFCFSCGKTIKFVPEIDE